MSKTTKGADMLTLEALGLSVTEIQDRVVQVLADRVMESLVPDEEGEEVRLPSAFAERLQRRVLEQTNRAIEQIAAQHILPNVAQYVETLCLQETNRWGEKTGKALTFTEYLVARAEAYLREEVNYQGKTKGEDSYSWKASGTRVAHLVHAHLHYSIQTAMEQALRQANSAIAGGIEQAIKIKLGEVLASLKVETKVGR